MRWAANAALALVALALAGCAPRHRLEHLGSPDGTLVVTVDHIAGTFGLTEDATVSLQEKRGLASSVATFRNVERLEVSWLGPEDLNICQQGQVIGYKTAVILNTSKGNRTIHVRYGC